MKRRDVSIRWSLLRNLLLLIALLSASILGVTFLLGKQTVRRLSHDLVERTADRTEAELRSFFEPVTRQVLVARDWARAGLFTCDGASCLNSLLPPIMRNIPQISSVNTGDEAGRGVLVLRGPEGWRNRETRRDEWGPRVKWTTWSPVMEKISESWADLDYDPRARPWYAGALQAVTTDPPIHWTPPYTFKTTGDPGITASVVAVREDGTRFVVAYDVLLKDVSGFTRGLDVSAHGMACVVAEDGRVVGLPRAERWNDEALARASLLKRPEELGVPAVAAVARGARADRTVHRGVFDFELEGETWWAAYRPFRPRGGPPLFIGVAVPESDFLGDVRRERTLILALTALALVGAGLLSVLLARRYSRPLEELASQSQKISELDMEGGLLTPSGLREVTRLHEAQDRMRSALDSFARYVPTEVVRDLLRRGEAAQIGGRLEVLTILFTDIEGFTSVSEGMEPDELTAHMAEYFDVMLRAIRESGGTIDKLIGDAIVAFWGAPNPVPEHATRAVEAVLECRRHLARLNEEWRKAGRPALPTRFGLTTGSVVVGNVGTPARLHYTVLGDIVNLASRLEAANKLYGTRVLAEERTVKEAGPVFRWRKVERVAVKGRAGAVDVYELLGRADALEAGVLDRANRYEEALAQYQATRFGAALESLRDLEDDPRFGESARRLMHLCRQRRADPPPEDWDGTAHLSHK